MFFHSKGQELRISAMPPEVLSSHSQNIIDNTDSPKNKSFFFFCLASDTEEKNCLDGLRATGIMYNAYCLSEFDSCF